MEDKLKALEKRVKGLEEALGKLQSFEEEQYSSLSNTVDNSSQNTYQLAKYALRQYQIMKYMITFLCKKSGLKDEEIASLWRESYDTARSLNFESDLLDDFKNNSDLK